MNWYIPSLCLDHLTVVGIDVVPFLGECNRHAAAWLISASIYAISQRPRLAESAGGEVGDTEDLIET